MVTTHSLVGLAGIGLLFSFPLFDAKGLPAYRVGDTAEENIATPVALDVIDADATAARKAAEALKTPAIFRSYPNPTNAMVREFTGDFEKGRTSYTAILRQTFGEITNADEMVNSDRICRICRRLQPQEACVSRHDGTRRSFGRTAKPVQPSRKQLIGSPW